jgi:hypothetical protein
MAQSGATARDAAIGELEVEFSKRGGDVEEEEAIEETDWCISSIVSIDTLDSKEGQYLKAGNRPKKAIKTTRDRVMVRTMMVRAKVMMKDDRRVT